MKVTKKDKEYFKKLGDIIEKENKKRMRELGKLTIEEKMNIIFNKKKAG